MEPCSSGNASVPVATLAGESHAWRGIVFFACTIGITRATYQQDGTAVAERPSLFCVNGVVL